MLAVLYLICHIDRANIGNAKIEGMIEDLNMTGVQYNTVLSICGCFIVTSTAEPADFSSLCPVCSTRGPQQHPAQEVQATFHVSRHSCALMGNRDDLHGPCQELRWTYGSARLARDI